MRYYIDTEFNGNTGQLLSIALVRQDGAEFYYELPVHELLVQWVVEHVMPWMTNKPEHQGDRAAVTRRMRKFLEKDATPITFIGDWPEDLVHTLNLMLRDHGRRNPPIQFRMLMLDLPGFNTAEHSSTPHNALDDARALKEFVEQGIEDGKGGALSDADLALLQGT